MQTHATAASGFTYFQGEMGTPASRQRNLFYTRPLATCSPVPKWLKYVGDVPNANARVGHFKSVHI